MRAGRRVGLGTWGGRHLHDLGGWASSGQESRHGFHVGIDVIEEAAIAFAEIVEAWIAFGGFEEPMFRAFSVAGEADFALQTVVGKGGSFIRAEFLLDS